MEIIMLGVIKPNFNQSGVIYSIDGIAPTIRAYEGGNLEPKILLKKQHTKSKDDNTTDGY